MNSPTLRRRIGHALRQHDTVQAAALAIAEELRAHTDGEVRPRLGWVNGQLVYLVQSGLDRADGCMDQAALSISRDLALVNPFQLVARGDFDGDPRVLDWHRTQMNLWHDTPTPAGHA